jgi:hypothetical protein
MTGTRLPSVTIIPLGSFLPLAVTGGLLIRLPKSIRFLPAKTAIQDGHERCHYYS